MINELIKLAIHLDNKGYYKEADYIDKIVKKSFEIGPSSYSAKKLREFNLDRNHFIVRRGDPYRYIYVPDQNIFLVTEGPANKHSWLDTAGNATEDIIIREGQGGFDSLMEDAAEKGLVAEEVEEAEAASDPGTKWRAYGWTQFRDADGRVVKYIDDSGQELLSPGRDTTIPNIPVAPGDPPRIPLAVPGQLPANNFWKEVK
tara:strand:+ start:299 stop:904 length:606 start_codon:yes stop_codon:yes gene_type:complete